MQVRLLGGTLSLSKSVCWFRPNGGRCFIVRLPGSTVYFSERYGYWPHRRFLGFRWGWHDWRQRVSGRDDDAEKPWRAGD